ncbi:MAG: PIN domain-containing protein [Candidatus Omnitrophica bacterium]|nr:PIN domain-containing protein [Candidatus Omnitrophota bacterium]
MLQLKIYLDTSILSAYFDLRKPMRQLMTQKWCQNDLKGFSPFISTLVLEEISAHPDDAIKNEMLNLIDCHAIQVLEIDNAVVKIAAEYRKKAIPHEINDSIHLAVATYYKLDAVVSWNFKHIVNLKTIKAIHDINLGQGFAPVEIITIQNLGGEKYGSL